MSESKATEFRVLTGAQIIILARAVESRTEGIYFLTCSGRRSPCWLPSKRFLELNLSTWGPRSTHTFTAPPISRSTLPGIVSYPSKTKTRRFTIGGIPNEMAGHSAPVSYVAALQTKWRQDNVDFKRHYVRKIRQVPLPTYRHCPLRPHLNRRVCSL